MGGGVPEVGSPQPGLMGVPQPDLMGVPKVGYPTGQVRMGGTQDGIPPARDLTPPSQVRTGGTRGGVNLPPRTGQQMEYLIRRSWYASCVHAGGLSCFTNEFVSCPWALLCRCFDKFCFFLSDGSLNVFGSTVLIMSSILLIYFQRTTWGTYRQSNNKLIVNVFHDVTSKFHCFFVSRQISCNPIFLKLVFKEVTFTYCTRVFPQWTLSFFCRFYRFLFATPMKKKDHMCNVDSI